jgi:hypothetical protein
VDDVKLAERNLLSNKMYINLQVPCPSKMNRVLRSVYRGDVVAVHNDTSVDDDVELLEKLA